MSRGRDHGKSKRERILLAAEHVFAQRGYSGTTTREVAQKAGIANSLIFYYFKNKMALYEAVIQQFFEGLEELIQQNLNLELDRLGKLKRFLFMFPDFATTHRNLLQILLREMIDNGPLVPRITQRYVRPLYRLAAEFLKEGKKEALFRDVDPLHYLLSFVGMNVFYFIAEPLVRALGIADPYNPEETERRKIEVWNIVRSSLM